MSSIDIIGPDGKRLPARSKAPKGARYRARWRTPEGASRTRTFSRKVDAEQFLATTEHTKSTGAYVDPRAGRETFSEYAERWAGVQDWKATTAESFLPHLRRLLPLIGDLALADIDRIKLQGVAAALKQQGYAHSTRTITMHYAATILRAAHHDKLVAVDPTFGLKPPKRSADDPDGKVGPDDVPTRAEVLAILAATPSPFRAAVALGIAGLRVSEVLGVTADRYDTRTGLLRVDRQIQRIDGRLQFTGPKREKKREIVLPSVTRLEIARHLRDHHADGLLFRGLRGAEMLRRDQFYASAWRPALVAAGLPGDRFKFHSLHHVAHSQTPDDRMVSGVRCFLVLHRAADLLTEDAPERPRQISPHLAVTVDVDPFPHRLVDLPPNLRCRREVRAVAALGELDRDVQVPLDHIERSSCFRQQSLGVLHLARDALLLGLQEIARHRVVVEGLHQLLPLPGEPMHPALLLLALSLGD